MTKIKAFRFTTLLVLIIAFGTLLIGAAPSHTSDFYVNDYANVLSEETEEKILSTALALDNETTAQVAVLTVPNLDGEDIADFAVDTAHSWGIGDKDKDNGVLIVLAIEERQVWVTVGYGLEGTLTDIRTGQLQDQYAVPYYKNNDFDNGTLALFGAIVNEIRVEEYGLTPLEEFEFSNQINTDTIELSEGDVRLFLLIFFSPLLLIGFVMLCQFFKYLHLLRYDKKNGTNKATIYRKNYMGTRQAILAILVHGALRGGGFRVGGGRGGFGGGSGGGFRGGGGGFGGGGAGRGF